MTKDPQPSTTALDLASKVEALSPVQLKNSLYDLLMWQHKTGKRPGYLRQYIEAAYRQAHPRPETVSRQWIGMQVLTAGIGNA